MNDNSSPSPRLRILPTDWDVSLVSDRIQSPITDAEEWRSLTRLIMSTSITHYRWSSTVELSCNEAFFYYLFIVEGNACHRSERYCEWQFSIWQLTFPSWLKYYTPEEGKTRDISCCISLRPWLLNANATRQRRTKTKLVFRLRLAWLTFADRSLESIEKLADGAERLATTETFAEKSTMIGVIAVFGANRLHG